MRVYLLLMMPLIAVLAPGCALLSSPNPVTGTSVMRAAMDGRGNLRPGDQVTIDEAWAEGEVELFLREEFFNPNEVQFEGDYLSSREVKISRKSSPIIAGEVAVSRAEATGRATADLFDLLAAAAPIVTRGLVEYRTVQEENRTLRRLYELEQETRRIEAAPVEESE